MSSGDVIMRAIYEFSATSTEEVSLEEGQVSGSVRSGFSTRLSIVKPLYKGHAWGQLYYSYREFGCFQRLFFFPIMGDRLVPFMLVVVERQVTFQSPFVEQSLVKICWFLSLSNFLFLFYFVVCRSSL